MVPVPAALSFSFGTVGQRAAEETAIPTVGPSTSSSPPPPAQDQAEWRFHATLLSLSVQVAQHTKGHEKSLHSGEENGAIAYLLAADVQRPGTSALPTTRHASSRWRRKMQGQAYSVHRRHARFFTHACVYAS